MLFCWSSGFGPGAGAAYVEGLPGVIADPFGAALCLLVAGMFYVRILRRMSLLTLSDFFTTRYGPKAGILASLAVVPCYVGWIGAQFIAFGYILHGLLDIPTSLSIGLGAGIVLAYTVAGGMWVVAMTDFLQGVVLIGGLVVLFVCVWPDIGWTALASELPAGRLQFFPNGSFKEWIWYIEAWMVIGLGSIATPDLFQRVLGAKDESVAQKSAYLAGLLYLSVGLLPVFLGMAGAMVVSDIANPEMILPTLGMKYLHPVAMAVFVGALLSAIMSSADSALLAPASIIGQNLVKPLWPDLSERRLLTVIRVAIVGLGLISLAIGLYFGSIYELMVNSWAILLVTLFVPLTAGIYWPRANGPAAVASIVVGGISWASVQSEYPADLMAPGPCWVDFGGCHSRHLEFESGPATDGHVGQDPCLPGPTGNSPPFSTLKFADLLLHSCASRLTA